MRITDVRVRKITKEGKMKAVVSITLDDEFVVHDIKVIEGEKGLFIAMPSMKSHLKNRNRHSFSVLDNLIELCLLPRIDRILIKPQLHGDIFVPPIFVIQLPQHTDCKDAKQ